MGGFEPLPQEFVQTYAPQMWDVIPQEAWSQTKVDGVSYCIPAGEAVLRSNVYAMRGDLMDKAGVTDITTHDELIDYLNWVADNQSGIGVSPFGAATGGLIGTYIAHRGLAQLSGFPFSLLYYNFLEAGNLNVEYLLDLDWFRAYCADMKEYYDRGWWSQDSLATTSTFQENFLRGDAATFSWNIGSVINFLRQADAEHPDWNVTFVDSELAAHKWVEAYNNNNIAINAFSNKKERAMMAMNELYCNKEVHRLIRYGVEGLHYILVDDTHYSITEGTNNYPIGGNCPAWAIKNPNFTLQLYLENPTVYESKEIELRKQWEKQQVPPHPLNQFTLDTTDITTQVAMINSLRDQYYTPVISGMAGDVDAAIDALRNQLERAGIRDVIAEAQRQINSR